MPKLVDQFGAPLSSVDDTDIMYLDKGTADGYVTISQLKNKINPAIGSLGAVVTPALADLLVTEQGGVNKKITGTQVRDMVNPAIASLPAVVTPALADLLITEQGGVNKKISGTQLKTILGGVDIGSLSAVVTPSLSDLLITEQGGTNKKLTGTQLRQAIISDSDYDELISSYPNKGWEFVEHFHDPNSNGIIAKTTGGSGTGLNMAQLGPAVPQFDGEYRSRVLTNTGYLNLYAGAYLYLGRGKAVYESRIYPIMNEVGKIICGFVDTSVAADADQQNGCWLEYDPRVSANWTRCTARGGSRTRTSTGIAYVGSAVCKLRVEVSADRSQVDYFINGSSAGSETSNIPLATTTIRCSASQYKISGAQAANNDIHMDYIMSFCKYTTPN